MMQGRPTEYDCKWCHREFTEGIVAVGRHEDRTLYFHRQSIDPETRQFKPNRHEINDCLEMYIQGVKASFPVENLSISEYQERVQKHRAQLPW